MVKDRGPKPIPSSDCRGLDSSWGLEEPSTGYQKVVMSDLLTLLVRSGGAELGSGLRVAGRAVGSGCVDALRRTSTLP